MPRVCHCYHESGVASRGLFCGRTVKNPRGRAFWCPKTRGKEYHPVKMYIGMDVHCKESVYVVQDEEGKVLGQGSVATGWEGFREILSCVHAPKGTVIGLETGVQATWVSRLLSGLGMAPVVIDAREVRQKARRIGQKSDRRDALEICEGMRRGIYASVVYVPGADVQRLRRVLSRRRHFVKLSTAQINAAKFLLRSVGLGEEASSLTTAAAWKRLVEKPAVGALRFYLRMHAKVWGVAQQNVVALEEELGKALQPFKETVARLQTVPGVGPITAATFIAVLGTPQRFVDSGRVLSYIGLVPSTYDSGDRQRHGHLTKRGSRELRAMLCECAQHAAQPRHPLNPYFVRICSQQGYKKAVTAVAQRVGRILYRMWLKGEGFDVRKLNVVPQRRVRARTHYWRIRKLQKENVTA
jgi:transposase